MADKKRTGSKLLAAIGKTKKEQMAKLYPKAKPPSYPKVKGSIRGKGPYVRGTIGKKGSDTFLKRRAAVAGTKATKAKGIGIADVVGAGAAGYAFGKGWPKKLVGAVTGDRKKTTSHKDKAKRLADEAIKKQKAKKEKGKSRH
jgi:hypothetical protein